MSPHQIQLKMKDDKINKNEAQSNLKKENFGAAMEHHRMPQHPRQRRQVQVRRHWAFSSDHRLLTSDLLGFMTPGDVFIWPKHLKI